MFLRQYLVRLAVCLCGLAISSLASNAEDNSNCQKNTFNRDTAPPMKLDATDWHCEACKPYQFERAGCPQFIRPHAKLSNSSHYCGSLVGGGGQVFGGDGPQRDEGTWGWDYLGLFNRKVVFLDWNHGTRQQAGLGAYKTDGPKVQWHK